MITAYTDGGARGNPGPAGYGVYITDADDQADEKPDGKVIAELKGTLGEATNNVAEYRGLLAALDWAVQHGHRALRIRADSLLLVKQMRGEFRVKNPGLQRLYDKACQLVSQLDRVVFEHVPREQNKEADRLANEAMDEAAANATRR
jgi:probable phosphoglycerate mutase